MENYVNTFKLGTDPEFFIVDARETLVNFTGSPINTKIAYDHGGNVVELRPDPSYTAAGLIGNIKNLLQDPIFSAYKQHVWRGGAYHRSFGGLTCVGGHIHLELPIWGTYGLDKEEYQRRVSACDTIIRTMETLGIYPKAEAEVRRGQRWGIWGQVQIAGGELMHNSLVNQDYREYTNLYNRNIYRMEYRVPMSWMFDPRVAFITITGVKLAATSPITALQMLSVPDNSDMKVIWGAFIDFFRAFSAIDSDAKRAAYQIMRNKHLDNLKRLCVNTKEDFKAKWEKWTI